MKAVCVFLVFVLATLAEDTPALKQLIQGNLKFTAKTYKELAKANPGNFLVCPLSVELVLGLVKAGAEGETARQLVSGLNFPNTEETLLEAFKTISSSLSVNDHFYTLSSANRIYIKNGFGLKPTFKDIATNVFKANVEEIDFTKSDAASQINKWVYEKTHHKIDNLISPDSLDEDTRAILINALYFQGLWDSPFYDVDTKEKIFHVNSKKEEKVKMMEQTEHFNYYKNEKAQFLVMSYYGSRITMTIVLPDEIDGLSDLESNIESILSVPKYTSEKVHVQIPRINIEHKIDFIPILKEFGVKDLFDKNANLSRITSAEKLKISHVVQKTFIAVEEKGTTAAAATAAIAIAESAMIEFEPVTAKEFNANHPFVFIIRSQEGILFVGRYTSPN